MSQCSILLNAVVYAVTKSPIQLTDQTTLHNTIIKAPNEVISFGRMLIPAAEPQSLVDSVARFTEAVVVAQDGQTLY